MADLNYIKTQLLQIAAARGFDAKAFSASAQRAIIADAERLLHRTFLFDKPWDMERCTKSYRLNPMDYEAVRNDDPEWCFMLNRMDWLSDLILAARLTNRPEFNQAALAYLQTWVAQHPTLKPQNSTRTLDTGIRLVNVVDALTYLAEAELLPDEVLAPLADSLLAQANYLKAQYIPKYKTSNWGSIQTCALLTVLPVLLPDFADQPLYQWAETELAEQLRLQVFDDGMQWEQSLMYHVEVLNGLLRAIASQNQRQRDVTNLALFAKQMTRALALTLTPSGELELFGDTDRIVATDVFDRAAVILHQPRLKGYTEATLSPESLYWLGQPGVQAFNAAPEAVPDALVFDGVDSGNYAIRSSWQKDADFLFFNGGPLGSGHGHSDNNHFSLYAKGQPLLVDSGRYTYREDHPLRVALKTIAAHNAIMVDQFTPCAPSASWEYAQYGTPLKPYVRHRGASHYLEGTIIGSQPLSVWTRKIVSLPGSIWVVTDEVQVDGTHELTQYFHLDPSVTLAPTANGALLNDQWQLINASPYTVTEAPFSPRYNEVEPHQVLAFHTAFTDRISQTTIIAPKNATVTAVPILQNLDQPLPTAEGSGWQIAVSATERYSVGIMHQELFRGKKVYALDGAAFHAQAVVVHRLGDTVTATRMKV